MVDLPDDYSCGRHFDRLLLLHPRVLENVYEGKAAVCYVLLHTRAGARVRHGDEEFVNLWNIP